MVALTEGRVTKSRELKYISRQVAAGVKIFEGAIVALTAAGYATPGAVSAALKKAGKARSTVDNTGGGAGAKTIELELGCFQFANSAAGDAITIADVGSSAYIVDDQTVAKTNGGATRSVAGEIVDVDAQGVWIKFA
jgi:hypothetical protein